MSEREPPGGDGLSAAEFEALTFGHLPLLKRLALRMTRNEAQADDLVQEACLRAWKYRHSLDPAGNVKAWLCRILTNEVVRDARRNRPEVINEDLSELASVPPAARVQAETLPDEDLRAALDELPEEFANALVLHAVEGFAYKEIAEIQGVAIGTVMSRLHRARAGMRKILARRKAEQAAATAAREAEDSNEEAGNRKSTARLSARDDER